MSTQKRLVLHWKTLKGLTAIFLFMVIAALIEYLVIIYAVTLGVEDSILQWNFQFPGTNWLITIAISPLFHLVPIAVIIALVSGWIHLINCMVVKSTETSKEKIKFAMERKERSLKEAKRLSSKITHAIRGFFSKIKSGMLRVKGIAYICQRIQFARTTIKSALTILLTFTAFIVIASLLTYPQLIYQTITEAYQNNPSLLNFVKSTSNSMKSIAETLAPITSAINNALIFIAPSFRDFALSLGNLVKPLADLPPVGKYLIFQNIAAWASALTALFYGEMQKSYRPKKGKRS